MLLLIIMVGGGMCYMKFGIRLFVVLGGLLGLCVFLFW